MYSLSSMSCIKGVGWGSKIFDKSDWLGHVNVNVLVFFFLILILRKEGTASENKGKEWKLGIARGNDDSCLQNRIPTAGPAARQAELSLLSSARLFEFEMK